MKQLTNIPKSAARLLGLLCKAEYIEEIIGDLHEYQEELKGQSRWRRKLFFWFHVFNFLKPWALKKLGGTQKLNQYGMLNNYVKITWRGLLRQKLFSAINIGGLAIGLTSAILIFLYVRLESSFDNFYPQSENVYRIYQQNKGHFYRESDAAAVLPVGLAPALRSDFPEVEAATAIHAIKVLLSHDDEHFHEPGLRADQHYFEVFGLPLVMGNPATALSTAEGIVLTASFSKKIFGDENPMGKEILYHNDSKRIVTGIMADVPENSSLQFSYITSMLSSRQYTFDLTDDRWNNYDYHTFVRLLPGADMASFQQRMAQTVYENHPRPNEDMKTAQYIAQPMAEFHMDNYPNFDIGKKGNAQYVKLFSIVAALILLLACVNYMNLAISRSVKRAKEVGLRKVIGAAKGQLIFQFLTESIMMCSLALVISIGLAYWLAPKLGIWLDSPIRLDFQAYPELIPGLITLVLLIGIISGSYPALFMSSMKPVAVLKGFVKGKSANLSIQKLLVLGQYFASTGLVIGCLVLFSQFRFMQEKELGYEREHIVTVPILDGKVRDNIEQLKNKWATNTDILQVSGASELPTDVSSGTMARKEGMAVEDRFLVYRARVDQEYVDLFGLELLAGRNYSNSIQGDLEGTNRVINESAARAFGYEPEEAIGQTYIENKQNRKTIVGVVKDFHMHSMHMEIGPLLLVMRDEYFSYLSFRLREGADISGSLDAIAADIGQYSNYPVDFKFLDDHFDQLYHSERKLGEMLGTFTLLAVIIASLGLFGLAAYMVSQRTKEIGIRKVLGAPVAVILRIVTQDFVKLVFIAFALAIPLTWHLMENWLDQFAYRIQLAWWMFGVAGLVTLLVVLFTVGSHSIKAALLNPVESLRNE